VGGAVKGGEHMAVDLAAGAPGACEVAVGEDGDVRLADRRDVGIVQGELASDLVAGAVERLRLDREVAVEALVEIGRSDGVGPAYDIAAAGRRGHRRLELVV